MNIYLVLHASTDGCSKFNKLCTQLVFSMKPCIWSYNYMAINFVWCYIQLLFFHQVLQRLLRESILSSSRGRQVQMKVRERERERERTLVLVHNIINVPTHFLAVKHRVRPNISVWLLQVAFSVCQLIQVTEHIHSNSDYWSSLESKFTIGAIMTLLILQMWLSCLLQWSVIWLEMNTNMTIYYCFKSIIDA